MKAISRKPLTKDNVVEALNLEIIPLLRELRTALLSLEEADGLVAAHAVTHTAGQSDPIFGNLIEVAYPPTNYIAALGILLAHLSGIDSALSPYLVYVPAPASHVFTIDDAFKTVECTHAAPATHTIPLNASIPYPLGTVIRFLWTGAGQPTIAAAGTLIAPDGAKVSAVNKFVFAEQKSLDTWLLSGSCAA